MASFTTFDTTNSTVTIREDTLNRSTDSWPNVTRPERNDEWRLTADVIIYIVIGTIGIVGNVFVIAIMTSSKTMMKKMTNVLMVNQSSIDLVCSAFVIGHSTIRYNSKGYTGLADQLYCLLWTSKVFQWSAFMTSTYSLVVLTLDKYLQVIHPIYHRVAITRRKVALVVIIVWVSGPFFNFLITVPTSEVVNGVCRNMQKWPNEVTRRFVGILAVIIEFIVPLFVIVISYYRIFAVMRRRVDAQVTIVAVCDPNRPNEAERVGCHRNMVRARKNVIKTLMTSSACFVICWIWNQGFFLLFNLGFPVNYNGTFYHFTVFMVFLNFCTNPFVYSFKYNQFQERVKHVFCRGGSRLEDSVSQA